MRVSDQAVICKEVGWVEVCGVGQESQGAAALAGAEVPAEDDQVSAGLDGGDAGDEGRLAAQPQGRRGEQGEDEDGEVKAAKEKDQRESCMEM